MQMQAIKQNIDKTTQCKSTCKGESEQGREDQIKPHNASDMQRGKKADIENYGKACDARCKTENKGLVACMGVTACIGGDKTQKTASETKETT